LQNALLIFIKNPELGKVKTRLAKTVGEVNALKIYQFLLRNTFEVTNELEAIDNFVYYDEYIPANDIWSNGEYERALQKGNDLSEKFINAFEDKFNQGYKNVVLLMPDCPKITSVLISKAFKELHENDVVCGPTTDGGFYLIGSNRSYPELFSNKIYSTPTVFEELKSETEGLQLKLSTLPTFTDVDTEEDLGKLTKLIK